MTIPDGAPSLHTSAAITHHVGGVRETANARNDRTPRPGKTLRRVVPRDAVRSAELLADFENQMGSEFSFDDDAVWQKAMEAAEREVAKAQKAVAARCREMGIPDRFAPSLTLRWCARGYDNLIDKRKSELRRIAQARVAAIEAKAITQIELSCLEVQEKITVAGIGSEAAMRLIESLPKIETLMPALSYSEIAGEADPPIVEQLLSPNALPQQRYRDKQRGLRNAAVTLPRIEAPPDGGGQ